MYAGLKFALKFAYILPYKICGKRLFIEFYKFNLRKLFKF